MGINTGKNRNHQTEGYDEKGKTNYNLSSKESVQQQKRPQEPNKILTGHVPLQVGMLGGDPHQENEKEKKKPIGITDGRALPRELLDNGQGKSTTSDMEISASSNKEDQPPVVIHDEGTNTSRKQPHWLLLPPVIKSTGFFATGVTTEALQKQNKQQRIETLLRQPMESQWTIHRGFNILPHDVWSQQQQIDITSQMAPQRLALRHEAAGLLLEWESVGCPTNTGRDWTLEEIQAAIDRGPHQSALEPEAIEHFADKVQDKVKKGQARVVLWNEIKGSHPRQLKVSPVAAIPHKSRASRSILDLSFAL